MSARVTAFALASAVGSVAGSAASEQTALNPVRKVVNLLQALQKKVAEEGEKAESLHQKYMCYCKTSGGDLSGSISAAENKIPEVESSLKASQAKKAQLESDLKSHQADRDAAKASMAQAKALRAKEKAAFDNALGDNQQNLAALGSAIAAISKGMGGSFLQSHSAATLRALVAKQDVSTSDRQDILAFLDGSESGQYAPSSGEINGILKTMHDEMSADQKGLISAEQAAVSGYEGLMAAKAKEVAVLTQAFQEKTERVGSLGVDIATMQNDIEDTQEGLAGDQRFAAGLKANCAERESVHAKEEQMRADETVALADTIKILNDDDALELFKSTLPGASASLVQVQDSSSSRRMRATALLEQVKPSQRRNLDFVLLALRGRKAGFEKVVTLIDNLVVNLQTEQQDDDHKKEYCLAQMDQADDKQKVLANSISDKESAIADAKEGLATLVEEIAALKAGIAALDKSVAAATEQRKAEAAENSELLKSNSAAKELILFAKNRLNKFYNPKLYAAPPKRELSAGDRIYENQGGDIPTEAAGGIANTGITAFAQLSSRVRAAPAPPPAVAAAYMKKSEGTAGVISMMDLLVADLDKEMTEAATEEKNAQAEYEQVMTESAAKRTEDSKALTDKEAAHADLGSSLQGIQAEKKATAKELMGTQKYLASLKGECDWLLQYFDARKTARADEIESLGNAKAVLAGADYALVQRSDARARKFLHRA